MALDNSIAISPDGQWRLGISCGQFVLLSMTRSGFFHGEVVSWNALDKKVQAELIHLGWTDSIGTILLDSRVSYGHK